MLLICIFSYLKIAVIYIYIYIFIILNTYQFEHSIVTWARVWAFFVVFRIQKGSALKKSLGNVGICFHCNIPFYMLIASWPGYCPIFVSVVYLLSGPVGLTPSASIMCRFARYTLSERNGKVAHACRADVARGDSLLIAHLHFIVF